MNRNDFRVKAGEVLKEYASGNLSLGKAQRRLIHMARKLNEDSIEDGFGSTWPRLCPCGGRMQIVRPGTARCSKCGN